MFFDRFGALLLFAACVVFLLHRTRTGGDGAAPPVWYAQASDWASAVSVEEPGSPLAERTCVRDVMLERRLISARGTTVLTRELGVHRLQWRVRDVFAYPHAMLIGNQRSGTTAMCRMLCRSPQLTCESEAGASFKETHYWSEPALHCLRDAAPGTPPASLAACYLRHTLPYHRVLAANFTIAAMDFSITYLRNYRTVLPQLARHFPWLRLAVLLREPIASLASAVHAARFKFNNSAATLESEFEQWRQKYVYADKLAAVLGAYDARQLHVARYEQFRRWPAHVYYSLLAFLQLEAPRVPPLFLQEKPRQLNDRFVSCALYRRAVAYFESQVDAIEHLIDARRFSAAPVSLTDTRPLRRAGDTADDGARISPYGAPPPPFRLGWRCIWQQVLANGQTRGNDQCHPEDYGDDCIQAAD